MWKDRLERKIRIGDRLVGPGERIFLTGEIGPAHGGSMKKARELVRCAAEGGCDGADIFMADPHKFFYKTLDSGRLDPFKAWEDLYLTDDQWRELIDYGKSLGEIGNLHLVGLVSRVLGLFLLLFTIVLCAISLFTFAAVAVIDVLANYMAVWGAALVIGGTYVLIIIVAILCRKQLFIQPFIKLLTKQIRTEEELELKTLEAENNARLHRVRMECQVQNATRELTFYAQLIKRLWNAIFH